MMYEKGVATSLKNVGEKFLEFVQKSNDITEAWEVMDDRLDTFYGATIKFPVDKQEDETKSVYAYISLQHNDITATTYNDWLRNTKDNYMSESYDHRNMKYTGKAIDDSNMYTTYKHISYYNSSLDILDNKFSNLGSLLFIGLHTGYDKNLWMCEQSGITCMQESDSQSVADNGLRPRVRVYPWQGDTYETTGEPLPPFPGMGCPALTVSAQDNTIYGTSLYYVFTRDNYTANIVIYKISEGMRQYNKWLMSQLCQHISFGRLNTFSLEQKFKYPLYVAGGSSMLNPVIATYRPLNAKNNSYAFGNEYFIGMNNANMSNSFLLLPTKINDANISNFRVMRSDGTWEYIFTCKQSVEIFKTSDTNPLYTWGYNKLTVSQGYNNGNTTLNNGVPAGGRIDTYTITKKLTDSVRKVPLEESKDMVSSSPLVAVVVCLGEMGVQGEVPNCYSTWSRNLSFGEYTIDNKRYLCIPCVWDLRCWDTPKGFGECLPEDYAFEYNERYNTLYNHIIHDKLMLYMGEVE